jgi:hypothetical protein
VQQPWLLAFFTIAYPAGSAIIAPTNRNAPSVRGNSHRFEHLRAIRGSVERTEYDIKDLKFRLGPIDQTLVSQSGVLTALKPIST